MLNKKGEKRNSWKKFEKEFHSILKYEFTDCLTCHIDLLHNYVYYDMCHFYFYCTMLLRTSCS